MNFIIFLILFPILPALLLALTRNQLLRAWLVRFSVLVLIAVSLFFTFHQMSQPACYFNWNKSWSETVLLLGELSLTLYLLYRCKDIKRREFWIPLLLLSQTAIMAYTQFAVGWKRVDCPLYVDNFSLIMALIISINGGLICIYSIAYMKDFHQHHPEFKDHRRGFFFLLFLFLSAMFGIAFSNNLTWLFFFWEITTMCSFVLIGYTGEEVAKRNAFLALGLNLIGGLGFALALLYLAIHHISPGLDALVSLGKTGALMALIPIVLISFAGLTKSALFPFSSWLLGAMVAPTPVSALLHASTMVKAGVFIIVKFAPVMEKNTAIGFFLGLIGGVTFLMASMAAVTQSNAKRLLAYSTIANLGLVVACAGVGTSQAIWAAILLMIFHSITKALLFQTVGTVEHKIGSRDIEDMDGLIATHPQLAFVFLVGIMGMFLAPFGMLISKWACLEVFIQSNPALAILLAFGSAPTLFFWGKWMAKLVGMPDGLVRAKDKVNADEWTSLGTLTILTLAACGFFPVLSKYLIEPYLQAGVNLASLSQGNMLMMLIMLGSFLILPPVFLFSPKRAIKVAPYLAGANIPPDPDRHQVQYQGSMGQVQNVESRNYYFTTITSEKTLLDIGGWVCAALIFMFLGMSLTRGMGTFLVPLSFPYPVLPINHAWEMITLPIFLMGAPLLGGLLAGLDRIVTARMQGRVGPPLLQPFYDIFKLFEKRSIVVNHAQIYYVVCYLFFMILTGAIFFTGRDLLLSVFALTVASLFLVLAASSPNSPYSSVGAQRELLLMMAYEPMLLLSVLGIYLAAQSFHVQSILAVNRPLLWVLPGIFLGFLLVLTMKLRKSPFDLSTSHHGHQELVKGLTTEFSGSMLALVEVGEWYEDVFLLGFVFLFFSFLSLGFALAATLLVFLFEILVDNSFTRLTWQWTLQTSWMVAATLGVINLLVLSYFKFPR